MFLTSGSPIPSKAQTQRRWIIVLVAWKTSTVTYAESDACWTPSVSDTATRVFRLNVPLCDKLDVDNPNLSNSLLSLAAANKYN